MDNSMLREMVFLALGKVSMCWSETPKGVFNDERAVQIGEELLQSIDAYVAMRQAGTEPFLTSLIMRGTDGNELSLVNILMDKEGET